MALRQREGASTIEMQLVRVLTGRFELTLARKIREAALATLVASSMPKSEILALYLQVAYYGTEMTSYLGACSKLGYHPQYLGLAEAASVVARLKYPQPAQRSDKALLRIRGRTAHLLRLHQMHLETRVYRGLLKGKYATV